jgi:hypothetical protein
LREGLVAGGDGGTAAGAASAAAAGAVTAHAASVAIAVASHLLARCIGVLLAFLGAATRGCPFNGPATRANIS